MKKLLITVIVSFLILSFVFQPSSAIAITKYRISEPEVAQTYEIDEDKLSPDPFGLEYRNILGDPYVENHLDPDLPEEIRTRILEKNQPFRKPEYTPPTPEVIAKTRAQVEAFDCSTITDVPQIECEALVALYASTNGAGWYQKTNWLTTTEVENWHGVSVFNGQVYELKLEVNLLCGSLPAELANLTNMQFISFSYNQLTGSIPSELGGWAHLQELYFGDNLLTGPIPLGLGSSLILNIFDMANNQLTGSIPPDLGNSSRLRTLNLRNNQLTGPIPPELGNLSTISEIYLDNNQLSGFVPSELGNLDTIHILDLSHNQLTGSVPMELGYLSNPENFPSIFLDLSNNLLTGPIPKELSNSPSLGTLDLSGNQLSGVIPIELGSSPVLSRLYLSRNQLTGSIPPELGNLQYLQVLDLSSNKLTGSIPTELGNLPYLDRLDLHWNQFISSIPLSFTQLVSLDDFNFRNTGLCEPNTPEFLAWKETVSMWTGTGIICEIDDPEGDWLIMYYLVGDNDTNQNVFVLHNYLTGIRNANIDLAIYWDRKYFGTEYLYRWGSGDETKENFENLDSDNPQTLIDFVNWATSKTNKAHTALVLVDHGNALAGFGWDEGTDSFKYLSHKDLGYVFNNIDPIDVLFMEACTLANLEPVWEFREHVKYYVGHEGFAHLFPYSHSYINNIPASFSVSQIAYNIADSHFRFYDSINFASTVSVLDLQKLDELVVNLSQLSYAMLTAPDTVKDAVWIHMISPDLYRVPISQKKQVVDLLQFVTSIMEIPELNTYANSVVESILDLVRYNGQVSTIFVNNENANGVSVALPVEKTSFYSGELFNFASSADWSQTNNNLSQDLSSYDPTINYWGLFVSTYVLENNPESEDSPEPPPLLPLETLGVLYLPIIITTD